MSFEIIGPDCTIRVPRFAAALPRCCSTASLLQDRRSKCPQQYCPRTLCPCYFVHSQNDLRPKCPQSDRPQTKMSTVRSTLEHIVHSQIDHKLHPRTLESIDKNFMIFSIIRSLCQNSINDSILFELKLFINFNIYEY